MNNTLKAALLVSSALIAAPALAQTPLKAPPPQFYSTDANGVDLVNGAFRWSITPVQIGDASGGLAYSRTYFNSSYRDNVTGTLTFTGGVYYLSIGGSTDSFTRSGSTFTPVRNVGQTLVQSGTDLTYTTADGTTAIFSTTLADQALPLPQTDGNIARITSIRQPNGETQRFTYDVVYKEIQTDPNFWAARIRRVENNHGYALNFTYVDDFENASYSQMDNWRKLQKVTAFNLAECPDLSSCSTGTVWPSATFEGANITDQSGRTVFYGATGVGVLAVRYPANPTVDAPLVTFSSGSGRVSSVANAGGTWTYAFADSGGARTTTVTDPDSGASVATSSLGTGLLTSLKDQLDRTTSFTYDTNRRLTKTTLPQGNSVAYAYDARGNVTQTTAAPPSGSTEPNIVTSAAYPITCANVVVCNAPISTTDARGAVTDYSYDSVHGGITAITAPAPATGGERPQTRVTYAAQTAWISNGAGGFVADPDPIVLPVSVSSCATGTAPACVDTSAEVRQTVQYGVSGAANNLAPTLVTQRDGTGTLSASVATTYTTTGETASVDGPLPGTDDTTYYRYDSARRPVGVIGPDPDGSGSLMRRAQRITYNADDRPTQVEQGAVVGLTDPDWNGFISLQQALVAYDGYSRPVIMGQRGGGQTHAVTHVGYDTSGRQTCVAQRMNPAAFDSLPGSACDLGAPGAYGPDRITRYGYDAAGQLTASTAGYGTATPITEQATYTANGMPLTLKDGAGNVSTMVYDGFDRLSQLHYPDTAAASGTSSATDYEAYGYDVASNVVSVRNRAGETEARTYDAGNRIVSVVRSAAPATVWTYDNLDRPLTISGNNIAQGYGWDALGRRTRETTPLGTVNYGYDLAGRRTSMYWPDEFWVAYDYNLANELTAIRENGAPDWNLTSWAYDNLGRPIVQSRANGAWTTWGYDGASRLTSLSHDLAGTSNDLTLGFSYNPAGQIITRTMSNPAYAYTPGTGNTAYANNGKNQVTSVNGNAVGYDGRGNIVQIGGTNTQTYNGLNELTAANTTSGWLGMSYDPSGRLYQTTDGGGAAIRFLYDGQQAIGEYDQSGTLLKRYVPGLDLDNVLAAYEGATYDRRYLLADERGSVVSIADGAANALTTNTYDEYGQPGSGNAGRFQYTGQMWLPQAQLYHYRARAYAPQLGRFMQADPIGYAAGANLYAYVGADPVNWTDPLGLARGIICVGPAEDPKSGEKIANVIGHGYPNCEFVDFSSRRGRGGSGGFFPGGGSDFARPSIRFDPTYSDYNEARTNAMNSNSWMAIPVLAPGAVVVGLELGAGAAVTGGGRAAGSLFGRVCNCFVAGTEVQTVDGLKSIEQIVVGDQVLARDDATGETAFKPVAAVIDGSEREIWEVTVETTDPQGRVQREPIGTTDEHPWRTAAGVWLETKDLTPGMELVSADGDRAIVITVLKTDRVEPTYNFEVEGFHTYFVGESQVWVHNACDRFFRGALRDQILKEGAKCIYCKNAATQVDHVVPFSRGGPTTLSNGVPACASCNSSKGAQSVTDWLLSRFGR